MKLKNQLTFVFIASLSGFITLSVSNDTIKATIKASAASQTLRILNWEDYIYVPESDEDEPSIIDQFKDDYFERTGQRIDVVYDTYSTNEEMYSTLTLGSNNYDLVAPSDYMIERLIRENKIETIDKSAIPNYLAYASPFLQDLYEKHGWDVYAAGYMWGTLGILYNKEVTDAIDMTTWKVLWDNKYQKEISVKDSLREGYFIGLAYVQNEALEALKVEYEDGLLTAVDYNEAISNLLNDTSDETIAKVKVALDKLKGNIYGTEVDQGKNDMIKGTVSMNTAWSGDAVYAIYEAADAGHDVLRYSLPLEGSNIWYDGFVMPKGANKDLAQAFINFVSDPKVAALNTNYIGYTSFIAGDSVLENINSYEGVVETPTEDTYELDLTYFFEGTLDTMDIADAVLYIEPDYVGGRLTTQYPSADEIIRSAVMRDFGDANQKVIDMWAEFKATDGQLWMYIVAGATIALLVTYALYSFITKNLSSRRRRYALLARKK
jgi:spermidine/putrescine transport system substrate-binding protein